MVTPSRRPITDPEQPHLDALGAEVRALRLDALPSSDELAARAILGHGRVVYPHRVTQAMLATRAQLSVHQVSYIERGRRRTRRSTLERIVSALVDDDIAEEVLEHLVDVAGPALAPEADEAHRQRIAARRERRTAKQRAWELRMLRDTVTTLRQIGTDGKVGGQVQRLLDKLQGDIARLESETEANPAPAPRPPAHRRTVLEEMRESPAVVDESRRSGSAGS